MPMVVSHTLLRKPLILVLIYLPFFKFIISNSGRYRVQSDSTEFCAVVIEELVRRIKKHQPDVQLKIPMPLHMFMNSILQFLEASF